MPIDTGTWALIAIVVLFLVVGASRSEKIAGSLGRAWSRFRIEVKKGEKELKEVSDSLSLTGPK